MKVYLARSLRIHPERRLVALNGLLSFDKLRFDPDVGHVGKKEQESHTVSSENHTCVQRRLT